MADWDLTDDPPEPTLIGAGPGALRALAAFELLKGVDAPALADLAEVVEWIALPGGTTLFRHGDEADAAYLVLSGSLGLMLPDRSEVFARVGAGQSVGEMGLIADRPRNATVVALRDSDVLRLPKAAFDRLLARWPELTLRLARIAIERAQQPGFDQDGQAMPRTFSLLPASAAADVAAMAEKLVHALSAHGKVELVWSTRGEPHTSRWFHNIESRNDFVVYAGEPGDSPWTRRCVRHADCLVLLARSDEPAAGFGYLDDVGGARQRSELVLLHEQRFVPGAAAAWRRQLPDVPVHHLREPGDVGRVARLLTGQSVGLVLSGGGARGLAHIGVIRALREAGVPIDAIGGTSIGAIMAAGVAMGWDDAELRRRIRRSFVDSNPLSDFTLPVVSLVAGRKVGRLLRQEFGRTLIEDLAVPFFCISANLTTGRQQAHTEGPLWQWLRASIAIPGVLPPVFSGGQVYVDGGAINNLPVDVMRVFRRGRVVGVDTGADQDMAAPADATEAPRWWRPSSWSGAARQRPGILKILWQAGMVNSSAAAREHRKQADVLLRPPLEGVDLLDWRRFDEAIEAGYRHTVEVLSAGGRGVPPRRGQLSLSSLAVLPGRRE
jgi:NTE family protein